MVAGLAKMGVQVTILSRREDGLDLRDERSVEQAAEKVEGSFDLIVVATGGLELDGQAPEKSIRALSLDAMAAQFAVNAIGPALCLKYFSSKLAKDRSSVFAVLTAKIGSIEDNRLGGWISYRAAKAAANQIVKTAAIEIARGNPQAAVVALHPGTVETAMTQKYVVNHPSVSPQVAAENLIGVMSNLTSKDTGSFIAYDGTQLPW